MWMDTLPLRKKNASVMLLVALLFFAGHYGTYAIPIQLSREMCVVCSSALLGLCLFGMLFLLADFRGLRSRRIFALQMLLVALAAGFTVMRMLMQDDVAENSSRLLAPGMLVYGNAYAFIMLMYPLELLYPGRMAAGTYFKLFIPALLTGLFYYGYINMNHQQVTEIGTWNDLLANFQQFNVWFRFIVIAYPLCVFAVIIHQKKRYITWHRKRYADQDDVNLGWIDYYLFGYLLILISYMLVVLMPSPQNMLMHSICFLIFFTYSFYKVLQHAALNISDTEPIINPVDELSQCPSIALPPYSRQPDYHEVNVIDNKYRFEDKMGEYKIMLERWMVAEKPYLNKDFKLLDVMQALPLNRSYLSRIFNDAYGETFLSFIMRYRIEESVRLLESHPELTVAHIANICGFSSPTVFGRAFLKNKGLTPKGYRNRRQ